MADLARSGRQARAWPLVVALVSVPVLLVAAWVVLDSRTTVVPVVSTSAVFAPLETSTGSNAQEARVALVWSDPVEVVYSGPAGTVTTIPVKSGTAIAAGQVVLEVDGADVRAVFGDKPLYSTVTDRSSREQIVVVNDFLAALGKPVPGNRAKWTSATTSGVRAVAKESGWPEPAPGEFDPQWTVWVPRDGFVVDHVVPRVGFLAPGVGEVVLSGRRTLVEARINPTPDAATTYTLRLEGGEVPVIDGAADLVALSGLVTPPEEGSSGEVSARLVNDTPAPVVPVAPGAVLIGTDGRGCLVVRHGGTVETMTVETTGGTPGVTYLRPDDALTGEYLTNPLTTTDKVPLCRS
ncbi:MAG: hypothetical protein FWH11_13340 [Micrococcales bacterium]|nr:hypothetical protein [Micrococcales bacterium]